METHPLIGKSGNDDTQARTDFPSAADPAPIVTTAKPDRTGRFPARPCQAF